MPHGHPDYGESAPVSTVYSLQDLGELAARLGSIVTFDRRGNVLWFDDFEDGINKWNVNTLDGATLEWSAHAAKSKGFSAKLTAPASLSFLGNIGNFIAFPVLSRFGLEVTFNRDVYVAAFEISLSLFDGTTSHKPGVRWKADGQWQILNEDLVHVDLPLLMTFPYNTPNYQLFQTAKLVVDFTTHKYVRLLCNNEVLDLSSYSYFTDETTSRFLSYSLQIGSNDASHTAVSYIDDVIITQNEP